DRFGAHGLLTGSRRGASRRDQVAALAAGRGAEIFRNTLPGAARPRALPGGVSRGGSGPPLPRGFPGQRGSARDKFRLGGSVLAATADAARSGARPGGRVRTLRQGRGRSSQALTLATARGSRPLSPPRGGIRRRLHAVAYGIPLNRREPRRRMTMKSPP